MSRLLCTMVGRRIVVCALHAMSSKQMGRVNSSVVESLPAAPGIVASDCRTHGGNRFSLLKSAVAVLRPLHRKFFQHRKSVGAGFARQCHGAHSAPCVSVLLKGG